MIAVYVDPTEVRQGIGTTILQHAVALARTEYEGPVRLEATLNARDFYDRAGFREIKRSAVRRNEVDVPVVVMKYDG